MTGKPPNPGPFGVASAYSTKQDGVEAISEACSAALDRAGLQKAQWGVFFTNVCHFDRYPTMVNRCMEMLGTDRIVGCSASGILTESGEVNDPPAVGLMAGSSKEIGFEPFLIPGLKKRSHKVAEEILENLPENTTSIVLFPDIFHLEAESFFEVFNEFNRNRENPICVVGGAPSTENPTQGTFQFARNEMSQGGVSGFYLSSAKDCHVAVSKACRPISKTFEITACEGKWILELDGKPAFEVLKESMPAPLMEDLKRLVQCVFIAFPADAEKPIGPGNFLVRNIIGIDPSSNVLACGGDLPRGTKISFAVRSADSAREDLKEVLKNLKGEMNGYSPEFGFYFNCCARGPSLYGMDDIDTSYITQEFSSIPLIGLASFAEIGPLADRCYLQTYTGVLLLA